MKKLLLLFLLIYGTITAQEKPEYSPKFSGYIRAWHQTDFSTNQSEFLVRMARVSLKGNVNEYAGYHFQIDFMRLGKLSTTSTSLDGTSVLTNVSASFSDILLDAEAIIKPMQNFSISLGQFKVPFSTDNLRGGADIDFVNRPLLTNVAPELRDVGLMSTYSLKNGIPMELKVGIFNGAGQNKAENDKTTNYCFRFLVTPFSNFSCAVNYYGGKYSGANLGIYDFGFDYKFGKFFLSGEFGKRKSEASIKNVISDSYFIYTIYEFNFSDSFISALLPTLRYEKYDPDNDFSNDEIERLTMGIALQLAKMKFAQLRLNYELYKYRDGRVNPNKIIIELQTRFDS